MIDGGVQGGMQIPSFIMYTIREDPSGRHVVGGGRLTDGGELTLYRVEDHSKVMAMHSALLEAQFNNDGEMLAWLQLMDDSW